MISIFEGTTKLPATEKIQSIEATKKAMFQEVPRGSKGGLQGASSGFKGLKVV